MSVTRVCSSLCVNSKSGACFKGMAVFVDDFNDCCIDKERI